MYEKNSLFFSQQFSQSLHSAAFILLNDEWEIEHGYRTAADPLGGEWRTDSGREREGSSPASADLVETLARGRVKKNSRTRSVTVRCRTSAGDAGKAGLNVVSLDYSGQFIRCVRIFPRFFFPTRFCFSVDFHVLKVIIVILYGDFLGHVSCISRTTLHFLCRNFINIFIFSGYFTPSNCQSKVIS